MCGDRIIARKASGKRIKLYSGALKRFKFYKYYEIGTCERGEGSVKYIRIAKCYSIA